jgi:hypothetical protein
MLEVYIKILTGWLVCYFRKNLKNNHMCHLNSSPRASQLLLRDVD